MTLADRLAALRAQGGLVRGQFQMDKAQVKADAIAGMASAVNSSLDRGMLGSSVDAAGRTGVLAQKASGMQAAIQAKIQGLLGIRTGRIQAANDYYTQLYDIQARKAAEQATLANQAFLNDLVMRMMDEQGKGPGGGNDRTAPPPAVVQGTERYYANLPSNYTTASQATPLTPAQAAAVNKLLSNVQPSQLTLNSIFGLGYGGQ
jgi:hypothetical protein